MVLRPNAANLPTAAPQRLDELKRMGRRLLGKPSLRFIKAVQHDMVDRLKMLVDVDASSASIATHWNWTDVGMAVRGTHFVKRWSHRQSLVTFYVSASDMSWAVKVWVDTLVEVSIARFGEKCADQTYIDACAVSASSDQIGWGRTCHVDCSLGLLQTLHAERTIQFPQASVAEKPTESGAKTRNADLFNNFCLQKGARLLHVGRHFAEGVHDTGRDLIRRLGPQHADTSPFRAPDLARKCSFAGGFRRPRPHVWSSESAAGFAGPCRAMPCASPAWRMGTRASPPRPRHLQQEGGYSTKMSFTWR